MFSNLAELLIVEQNITMPPIDLEAIMASRCIIDKVYFSSSSKLDAFLTPTPKGFLLRLNGGQHKYRHRFSIAHEIGHTFFYDLTILPPKRLIDARSTIAGRKEEDICSSFARALLVPATMIIEDITRISSNKEILQILLSFSSKYQVSSEVIVWRIIRDLDQLPNYVALFCNTTTTSGTIFRIYYGANIKKYIRNSEKAFIQAIKQSVETNLPLIDILALSSSHRNVAGFFAHESSNKSHIIMLIEFTR